jgi:hypothetical protein
MIGTGMPGQALLETLRRAIVLYRSDHQRVVPNDPGVVES